MSNANRSYSKFSYDEHARNCAPDDFLGQTRRTINGKPLPEDQIQMIVTAIKYGLGFKTDDVLLELACGNGALSRFLFDSCKAYLGVDISEHLVSVAKKNFEVLPHYQFSVQAATEYVKQEQHAEKFTKMLCYAGFQYLPDRDAIEILTIILNKFINIQTIFIGNLPNRDQAHEFYTSRHPSLEELSDCNTALGIWRTKDEFTQLAVSAGWKVKFSTMHSAFYSSHYRYDALLSRKGWC